MRHFTTTALIICAALIASACATGEEWATWKSHPTHFASTGHMRFSLVNGETKAPRISRRDLALAHAESWWGDPVTVAQSQITER